VFTRATRRKIPEDTILHSHRRENLKSYTIQYLCLNIDDPEEWRLSGMLRRVALVRTDVSEELSASIIRMIRIGELGTYP
jgi:hypothetical protein